MVDLNLGELYYFKFIGKVTITHPVNIEFVLFFIVKEFILVVAIVIVQYFIGKEVFRDHLKLNLMKKIIVYSIASITNFDLKMEQ